MKVAPARLAAFEILWRTATEDAYTSNLIASSRYEDLSHADHALAQELTLGVLRWQLQLDFLIEHFTRRKLSKLDLEVIIALRLGIYQLHFLNRIPPHAAINESVNLVKLRKKSSAAPMVNAILRNVQRADSEGLQKIFRAIKKTLEKASVETSHPSWLMQRWIARFGEDQARMMAGANNHAPRAIFRFNRNRQSTDQTRAWLASHHLKIADSTLVPNAAVIEAGNLNPKSEPIEAGWIYLQDEASQLVAYLLASAATKQPQIALDLCAAPGSKTTLLASLLPENSLIVACDLHLHRLQTLRELAKKSGISNLQLLQLDAAGSLPFSEEGNFDLVLLDAPCSGLGTLQRHPEIKWRMTESKISELASLQKKMLENAARMVRPGGFLLYSVCSTEPEEGEVIVEAFVRSTEQFTDVTRSGLRQLKLSDDIFLSSKYGMRTFPAIHQTEGFFICLLENAR